MTAKQPAAPAKASPVTQAKAKPTAGAAAAKKPALGADAPAAKGKPAPKAVALVKSAARTTTSAPAAGKRGAKAAAEPEKKLPDMPADEDFADLEADAEVSTAEAENKVKAKPLRMKVSRAKERALMREFGLEEATLTEEEVAKRRHELKTLIKMGKTRGFLTHQEISDHLPEKLVDNEILVGRHLRHLLGRLGRSLAASTLALGGLHRGLRSRLGLGGRLHQRHSARSSVGWHRWVLHQWRGLGWGSGFLGGHAIPR